MPGLGGSPINGAYPRPTADGSSWSDDFGGHSARRRNHFQAAGSGPALPSARSRPPPECHARRSPDSSWAQWSPRCRCSIGCSSRHLSRQYSHGRCPAEPAIRRRDLPVTDELPPEPARHTTGPVTEVSEQIEAFYLLDCPSVDAALVGSRRLPTYGRVEVRPLVDYDLGRGTE